MYRWKNGNLRLWRALKPVSLLRHLLLSVWRSRKRSQATALRMTTIFSGCQLQLAKIIKRGKRMSVDSDKNFESTGSTATVGTLNANIVNADSMSAWYPTVSANVIISWKVGSTTDAAPAEINIKGKDGATGPQGPRGPQGPAGAQFSWDGSTLR